MAQEVQELSGLDKDINDEIEEAKKLIRANDAEMNLAHFALQKLHILPSALDALDEKEKAFIYASIQVRIEEEKKQASKIKKKGGRSR